MTATVTGFAGDVEALLAANEFPVVLRPVDPEQLIRGSWQNASAKAVVSDLLAQLGDGVIAKRQGDTWYLGPPREVDLELLLLSVPFGDGLDFVDAYSVAAGGTSEVVGIGDQVVVSAPPDGAARARQLYDALQRPRNQYVVSLTVMEISERLARTVGLDSTISGEAGVTLRLTEFDAELVARAVGSFVSEFGETDGRVLTTQRLHLVEGRSARVQSGQSTPVPQRTVLESGVVTTTGFEIIETGVILDVAARSVSGGLVQLELAPEISDVTGFVDDRPIVSVRSLQSTVILEPGGMAYLSGLAAINATEERRGINKHWTQRAIDNGRNETVVFVRVEEASKHQWQDEEEEASEAEAALPPASAGFIGPVQGEE